MIHWRHEEDKKKRRSSRRDDARSDPTGSGTARDAPASSQQTPSIPMHTKHVDSTQLWSGSSSLGFRQSQNRSVRTGSSSLTSDSDSSSFLDPGSSSWQLTATDTASYFPRYQNKVLAITEKDVIGYEESKRHEERQLRSLVVGLANFYNVGGSHDPFDVLPQFRNPRLDALYLSRNCKSQYIGFVYEP